MTCNIKTAIILAGGFGTRISELSHSTPKPLVRIGDIPILLHIMNKYYEYGVDNFIICGGYRFNDIIEFFEFFHRKNGTFTFDVNGLTKQSLDKNATPNWTVTVRDTGLLTETGGRIKAVKDLIDGENFHLTYGDGVGNIDIAENERLFFSSGYKAQITAVRPMARFGVVDIDGQNAVSSFREKSAMDTGWINGGYSIVNKAVLDETISNETDWERDVLSKLAAEGDLGASKHHGFWHPMDTLRDQKFLEKLWLEGNAPWL